MTAAVKRLALCDLGGFSNRACVCGGGVKGVVEGSTASGGLSVLVCDEAIKYSSCAWRRTLRGGGVFSRASHRCLVWAAVAAEGPTLAFRHVARPHRYLHTHAFSSLGLQRPLVGAH